jgi:hypothetical protein
MQLDSSLLLSNSIAALSTALTVRCARHHRSSTAPKTKHAHNVSISSPPRKPGEGHVRLSLICRFAPPEPVKTISHLKAEALLGSSCIFADSQVTWYSNSIQARALSAWSAYTVSSTVSTIDPLRVFENHHETTTRPSWPFHFMDFVQNLTTFHFLSLSSISINTDSWGIDKAIDFLAKAADFWPHFLPLCYSITP